MPYSAADLKRRLDHMSPAAFEAHLGSVLYDLVTQHNALLAKLDTAALTGMGTNNAATLVVKPPEQR